ncbi:MAG: hypothetical protein J6K88_02070 [Oscillospiraceae bacterium]|nr:hypothetical protein [Oscillospiraceae bacterium]
MDNANKNSSLKGILGGILFSLIAILVWLTFSGFGLVGYWSAPAFGILIPLGFKILSKKIPNTIGIAAVTVIITLAVLLAAYLGYVMNTYILFIWEGQTFSEIAFSEVNDFIKSCWLYDSNYFRRDCIREIGIGLAASFIFEAIYLILLKRNKKTEVNNG